MLTDASAPVEVGPEGDPGTLTLFPWVERWCERFLRQPDGPDAGQPWRFTEYQRHIARWWYAIDERGRWLYRRGTLRLMKGAGKDPLGSVFAAVDFVGPCRFGGWADERAKIPKAVEHTAPWVQIVAVARDQTRTTMRLFPGLFSDEAIERYRIDVNKEIIYAHGGGAVIEAVTSSPLALEGPRSTLVIRNEIQNWRSSNAGHDMAEVIDGNLAKSRDGSARALSLCNAHVPGEDSVGEREWDAYQAIHQGRTRRRDVLYIAVEASPYTDLTNEDSLRDGLLAARKDAHWLDIERLMGEIWDPRTPPSEARRKYLNQIVAPEDAFVAPHEWDRLYDPDLVLADGEQITLGFDGSKTDDHSALIACRISDAAWFTLGVWDPARHHGEAPREAIDAAVLQAKDRYDVVAFFSDLHPFESYVDRWAEEFGRTLCVKASPKHPIAWDMRARSKEFTLEGAERIRDEVVEGVFRHDGDPRVRQHVHNARRRPNPWGVSFGKEHRESSRKIDSLPAGTLARMARRAYLALPRSKQRRKKSGKPVFI